MKTQEIRKLPYGDALYNRWIHLKGLPHESAWSQFPAFYNWAVDAGFTGGCRLQRVDPTLPFGPQNCVLIEKERQPTAALLAAAADWDLAVDQFKQRLKHAEAYNPAALCRLVDNMPALMKKAAPGTGTSESGSAKHTC